MPSPIKSTVSKPNTRRAGIHARGVTTFKPAAAKAGIEPLPFYAQVRVVQHKGVPVEVVGRIGYVLGRAQLKGGQWNYSVYLGGLNESYSLPHGALEPTGEILTRDEFYGPDKLRVVVNDQGAGSAVDV